MAAPPLDPRHASSTPAAIATATARARLPRPGLVSPAMTYRQGRFWQPDVTVATVVVHEGRLLCVEEHSGGRLVLNQPAGHLEPDEDLLEAAVRETQEETGWTVEPTAFIGAYQWTSPAGADATPGRHYLRFAFAAERVSLDPDRVLDEGIVRALWLTPAELQAEAARHRSPLVWQVVADYLAGSRQPLSLLRSVR